MNWDQIENKWTAMSRRLRPERSEPKVRAAAPHLSSDDTAKIAAAGSERSSAKASSAARQVE